MRTVEPQIIKEVNHQISTIKAKDDFELREYFTGFAFTIAAYCRQHFEPGTDQYNELYKYIDKKVTPIQKRAEAGLREFKIEIKYTDKNRLHTWGYSCTEQERTEQEVRQRIEKKKFTNLHTGRKIKPIFLEYTITEITN